MIILGLDMSSTCIGYATADGQHRGHRELKGDIAARCRDGAGLVVTLLDTLGPALVVIEAPVARFASAVIPQARVSGAVLAVLASRQALWNEVAPKNIKRLLAGSGSADKAMMVAAAAERLGLPGKPAQLRKKAIWMDGAAVLLTEDEADAYGLALAGAAMKARVAA